MFIVVARASCLEALEASASARADDAARVDDASRARR
jgi:hypothetical protein